MSELTTIYDDLDSIPESVSFRDLFTKNGDGRYELTGIAGLRTPADVSRIKASLEAEKAEHKETKKKLAKWLELGGELEEVTQKLDRFEELEAASGDKLDDAKIAELAEKRAASIIKTRLAPVERENRRLKEELTESKSLEQSMRQKVDRRELEDVLLPLMADMKVLDEHRSDALMYAHDHFEKSEDGWFVRDGVANVTAGSTPKDWLSEMVARRPRWLPDNESGGARGAEAGRRGGLAGKSNPWSHEGWNVDAQSRFYREHGQEAAAEAAKAAGSALGAALPPARGGR